MTNQFNDLPWHDAQLLEILIDRRQEASDSVLLRVEWPGGNPATLLFDECYGMNAEMNFGVIADDRILVAAQTDDDPQLLDLRQKWEKVGIPLVGLSCYRIETSSTASVIRIYATSFAIT